MTRLLLPPFRYGPSLAALAPAASAGGPSLSRTSAGLLRQDTFTSLTGWSGDSGFTAVSYPGYVAYTRLPISALEAGPNPSGDYGGVREGHLFIDSDGTWYLYYGAGDGTDTTAGEWRIKVASSTDQGLNWTRLGDVPGIVRNQTSNPGDGEYNSRDMLYMEKRGSTYYIHAMRGTGTSGVSSRGRVPVAPYESDIWSASTPDGSGGDFVYEGPGAVRETDTDWDRSNYCGSVVLDGSTYHMFTSTHNIGATDLNVARQTASSPDGPFTMVGELVASNPDVPENPKVFYSAALSKWVMLLNEGYEALGSTDRNALLLSDSLTDWATAFATKKWYQRLSPADGTNAIGIPSPLYGPDGAVVLGQSGRLPFTYDTDPIAGSGLDIHVGRKLVYAVLEPHTHALRYTPPAGASFSDDFDRADGAIGNGWVQAVGSTPFTISSNGADLGSSPGDNVMVQPSGTFDAEDVDITFDYQTGTSCSVGVVFRYTSSNSFYLVDVQPSNIGFYRKGGGGYTLLEDTAVSLSNPAAMRVRMVGSSLEVYSGPNSGSLSLVASHTDSSITGSGQVGMRNGGGGTGTRRIDNFTASAVSGTTAVHHTPFSHSDFYCEYPVDFQTLPAGSFVALDFRYDTATDNGYRLKLDAGGGLSLWEVVGGVETEIAAGTGSQVSRASTTQRVRLRASGTTLQAWLNGEQQVNTTDATYASGTHYGFAASGCTASVPGVLRFHSADTVQVTGLTNGQTITLRAAGGVPIATATVSGTSHTFSSLPGVPADSVDIDGTDHPVSGGIWGGDVFTTGSPALTRTVAGSLLDEYDFSTLSGWDAEAGWAADTTRPLWLAYPTGVVLASPGAVGSSTGAGIREFIPRWTTGVGSRFHAVFGSGDGNTSGADAPWRPKYWYSDDGTFTFSSPIDLPGLTNGSPAARDLAMAWVKSGSTYYLSVLEAGNQFVGIPAAPYANAEYTASSPGGTHAYQNSTPPLGSGGSANDTTNLIGWKFTQGGTYYGWTCVGDSFANLQMGLVSSSTGWAGPWSNLTVPLLPTAICNTARSRPENPQRLPDLGGVVHMTSNSTNSAGTYTDGNDLYCSPDGALDFTNAYRVRTQSTLWPLDALTTQALGIPAPVCSFANDPDSPWLTDGRGCVGFVFDKRPDTFDGGANTPGRHRGAWVEWGVYEPCPGAARFTGTGAKHLKRDVTHSNFVAEWSWETNADAQAAGGSLGFCYRRQGTANGDGFSGYCVLVFPAGTSGSAYNLVLYRFDAGTPVAVTSTTCNVYSSETGDRNLNPHRFKLVVSGGSHALYVNDFTTPAGSWTESTYLSGQAISFRGEGHHRTYHCTLRLTDTVTLTGLPASAAVVLRGAGGAVADTATADGSGNATVEAKHFPLASVTVNGTDIPVTDGVWGGDTLAYTA